MIRWTILLIVAIDLAIGQLNYEGNPLTENTEYTAEETRFSEKGTTKLNKSPIIDLSTSGVILSRPQKLYPVFHSTDTYSQQMTDTNDLSSNKSQSTEFVLAVSSSQQNRVKDAKITARQFPVSYNSQNSLINPTGMALNTFLNSRTPEESRMSLDHYLRGHDSSDTLPQSSNTFDKQNQEPIELDNHLQPQSLQLITEQQQQQLPFQMNQQVQLTPQINQNQLISQPQIGNQRQPLQLTPTAANYAYVNDQSLSHNAIQPAATTVIRTPVGILRQGAVQSIPFVPSLQTRNDLVTPTTWWQRMKRVRGNPFPFAQSRLATGLYKAPIAVPLKHKAGPIEVIYTKPPTMFRRGPPILSNPPVPYEDKSNWLPGPPSSKDTLYSQLYAQSYDPYYYNYIATTGKIRPYLYGKLGKREEEEQQEDGIWMELYRGFKKHGLKNMMTPTFLLGMTLPVVTLMLSALVQKRSIGRSDARLLDQENDVREYLEQLQRAMQCYNDRNSWKSTLKC